MEEINRSGGNAGAVHGQMYNMSTLLRAGSPAQKKAYLPAIARGELRLQSMAVTEPTTGTDTTKLKTFAVRKGDRYVVNGQKVWTSQLQHSDLMILLARTTPLDQVKRKSDGLSVFIVDVAAAMARGMTVKPIRNMVNHETNEVFFDDLEIPAENLIGEENNGFRIILEGLKRGARAHRGRMRGRRLLVRRSRHALRQRPRGVRPADRQEPGGRLSDRPVICFGQGRRRDPLQRRRASRCGQALWGGGQHGQDAVRRCVLGGRQRLPPDHGGFGFAAEYDVERKFRETRLYQVAPISTNLILAYVSEHVLGMPRSY